MSFIKKISVIVLSLIISILSISAVFATNDDFIILGDINDDYVVNVSDVTFIQMYCAGWKNVISENEDDAKAVADINKDNNINIKDVTCVQMIIADLPMEQIFPTKTQESTVATQESTVEVQESTSQIQESTVAEETKPVVDIQSRTVYYYNTVNWDNIYAYVWINDGKNEINITDSNNNTIIWPGQKMNDEGNNIYSISIPLEANRIIFNKNSDIDKTDDLIIPSGNEDIIYYNNRWLSYRDFKKGTVDVSLINNYDDYNYLYYWKKNSNKLTEWPGEQLKINNGIYSLEIPIEADSIVFYNGDNNKQTDDIDLPNNKTKYIYNLSTKQWE